MSKTIWSTIAIILCIGAMVYGLDEITLSHVDEHEKISDMTLSSCLICPSVQHINRSNSTANKQSETRRFLPLINAVEQEMEALNIPGAAVAIVEAGEVTFAAGFGSKHPYHDDPVEPTTLFRIGSVTKTLTAIGLLQLVEQGLVDINSPITDYLPDFSFNYDASWASSITVWNLLTHTSAIVDYFEIDTPGFKDDDALSRFFSGPYNETPYAYLMAPPGRMFNYTNPGYMLAGWVIESVSGTYYRYYMQENVLEPLGMTRTYFLPEQVIEDGDFACGSVPNGETNGYIVYEPNSYDNGWARPAGLAFSSVLDLAQLVKFIRAGRPDVLADELQTAMQKPQMDTEWFLNLLSYGYGLLVQDGGFYHPTASNFYSMRIISHGGDVPGFSADIYYVPDLDFGFVALTNAGYSHLSTSFAVALTTLCEMPAPVPRPDFSMTAADYTSYSGQYYDQFNAGDFFVRNNSNQLTVEFPLFEEFGLEYERMLAPSTRNNFILYIYGVSGFVVYPLQVTFIRDEDGVTEFFRTRSFVAQYIADIPTGRGRQEIFKRPAPVKSRQISDMKRYLPGPQLPFIKPPGQ